MEKEERSHQWKLAFFGLFAVFIGALIGLGGSWYIWHLQQTAEQEQKLQEQHNLAVALCFDVSLIEDRLNSTMNSFLVKYNDTNVLDDPDFIYSTNSKYYSINWIYNVFGKDISGLDSTTSADLYAFYYNIAEIDDYTQFVNQVVDKIARHEKVSPLELAKAHVYTNGLFKEKIPGSIQFAEKIKQELTQNYHTNIHLSPWTPVPPATAYYSMEINRTTNTGNISIAYN
jgi:hypothetical protein